MPRSTANPDTPDRISWYRRVPWWAVAITLVVLVSAAFARDPIREAATLGPVGIARLELSTGYLAIAPFSNVLDTLSLFTVGQHVAILLTAILVFVVARVLRARRRRGAGLRGSLLRELGAAAAFLVGVLLVYVAVAVAPRPMARLVVADPLALAVDFHAHTMHSHDGRPGWTEADVRAWQGRSGADVAYITDHRTYEGAERGIAANPPQAGQGVMLLQGLEAFYKGEHVNVLSAGRRYLGLTTPDLKDIDEQSFALASMIVRTSPVAIETVPGHLDRMRVANDSAPGVVAIEIVDGSPRGLAQTRRERARIVHLADSLDLALVTGSDNHGWGRAAPGWTLMRIPGWRGMTTDSLSRAIEDVLRSGRRRSTRPVERTVAQATNPVTLALSAPLATWTMFTTLGTDERVMWLVWTWGLVLAGRGARRLRRRTIVAA